MRRGTFKLIIVAFSAILPCLCPFSMAGNQGDGQRDDPFSLVFVERDSNKGDPVAPTNPVAPSLLVKIPDRINLSNLKSGIDPDEDKQLSPEELYGDKEDRLNEQIEPISLSIEESIKIALENNLPIQIATLNRDALETEIRRAKAIFHPEVGVSAIGMEEESADAAEPVSETDTKEVTAFISEILPTGGRVDFTGAITRKKEGDTASEEEEDEDDDDITSDYQAGLTISLVQPLLRGGRVFVATKPISDARYDFRIEEAKLRAEILRVTSETKSAYYDMILAESIIDVTKAAIERDKTLVEASEALLKSGLVSLRDVISAKISLAQDSEKLVNAQNDIESAKDALLDVLGLPLDSKITLLDREVEFKPVPIELERWIAEAVQNRPEIMEIEQQIDKSILNISTLRNSILPALDLVASYTRSENDLSFSRTFGLRGESWSAGLVFSVPIGNVAAKAELKRAEIEYERFLRERLQLKRQIELEVRAAVVKLRRSLERTNTLNEVIDHAKNLLRVAKGRFVLGVTTNEDVTDAQEDLLDAETDLLDAKISYNIGLTELEASVGGSF